MQLCRTAIAFRIVGGPTLAFSNSLCHISTTAGVALVSVLGALTVGRYVLPYAAALVLAATLSVASVEQAHYGSARAV
jgi:hypothetical protein